MQFSPSDFLKRSNLPKTTEETLEKKNEKISKNSKQSKNGENHNSKIRKIQKISKYFIQENSLKNIANSRGYTERYQNAIGSQFLGSRKMESLMDSSLNYSKIRRNSLKRRNNDKRTRSFGRKYSDFKNRKSSGSVKRRRKRSSAVVKIPKNSRITGIENQEEIEFLNSENGDSILEYNSKVHNLEKFLNCDESNISLIHKNQDILIENLEECKKRKPLYLLFIFFIEILYIINFPY